MEYKYGTCYRATPTAELGSINELLQDRCMSEFALEFVNPVQYCRILSYCVPNTGQCNGYILLTMSQSRNCPNRESSKIEQKDSIP